MSKWFMSAMLAVCMVVSLGVNPAWAEEEDDPFDGRLLPVELVMAFRSEIGLSSEQHQRLGQLVVDLQKAVADHQWQMQSAYFELIQALDAPSLNEDKVVALAEQAMVHENHIKVEQIRLLVRVRSLLNADQIQFLRDQLAKGWKKTGA